MRKSALVVLLSLFICLAFTGAQEKVSIAAAANISSVASALSESFAKQCPAFKAEFTFGASGALVTQLMNGAPFQIYMSADTAFPQKLVDAGATEGPVKVYAIGSLIFLTTKKLDLSKGLAVLTDPSVGQFANCNPETAPYGKAAMEALKNSGLLEKVKSKLVVAQTVTQALQFTLTSTDAGFVNKSALYSKEVKPYDKEGEFWFAVDPSLYSPIAQGFVVMKGSGSNPGVEAFAKFLSSAEARAVFTAYGYGNP
jgi:molybdate transport system substrate-binding protein